MNSAVRVDNENFDDLHIQSCDVKFRWHRYDFVVVVIDVPVSEYFSPCKM